jgi:hypothetical protein
MDPTREQDWADLGNTWQQQDVGLEFTEQELQARLQRQRIIEALLAVAEWLSFAVAVGLAAWTSRYWLTGRPGKALIVWLLLQAAVILWMRRRQRVKTEASVLDSLDASIERDDRLVESMRLGSLMGMLALAAMIVTVVMSVQRHSLLMSAASLASFTLLFIYVFAMQIALAVYARRVRRRRERLETIRRSLRALE